MLPASPIPLIAPAFVAAFAALEVPKLPPLTDDPSVIAVVDFARVTLLVVGLSVAALTARHAVIAPERFGPVAVAGGFRWRSAALVVGLLYVSLSAYDRLGQPVTLQFLMALIFVALTAVSIHRAVSLPLPELVGERLLLEHLRDRDDGGGGPAA